MKPYLAIGILTIFINLNALGQETGIDYSFLNSALSQVKKHDSTYVQLCNESYKCILPIESFNYYLTALKGKIDSSVLREIINNAKLDLKTSLKFDSNLFAKRLCIKLIPSKYIDSLQRYPDISEPLNRRIFYTCSKPAFDNKKYYAVIDFGGGTRRDAAYGSKYLFKKTKRGWKIIATFDSWVS